MTAKRLFDVSFSLAGLIVFSPLMLFVALLIKLDDGGACFYRQVRVGRLGREFKILKFRTMCDGADRAGPSITAAGDARITRVGRWLRKAKLDELPQLWNVLRGEMSFVGPRPEVPKFVALYTSEQRRVLNLIPGITDEASLEFRDEEEMLAAVPEPARYYVEYCIPRKVAVNLAYAKNASVLKDVFVIIRTMILVWLRR
jgi:Sugar transferases involved in lipopolysaccharide synthesis